MKLRPSLREELLTELTQRTSIPRALLIRSFTDRDLRSLVCMLWNFEELEEAARKSAPSPT